MRDAQISVLIRHAGVTIFPPFSQCPDWATYSRGSDLEGRVRDESTELVLAPGCKFVGSCEFVGTQLTEVR